MPLKNPFKSNSSTKGERRYLWNFGGGKVLFCTVPEFHFGRPWFSVVGSFFCLLAMGVFHSWGTLSIYVSDPGLLYGFPNSKTIWVYATGGIVIPFTMFIGAPLQKNLGFMLTAMIGCVINYYF